MSRIAICCAGGGSSGSISAGALYELEKAGVKAEHLFGNSAGALNVAAYSALGASGLIDIWGEIKSMSDVFKSRGWQFLSVIMNRESLYDSSPLRARLERHLLNKQLNTPITVNVVDLITGNIERPSFSGLTTKSTLDMVLASASIPIVAQPVLGRYVDGGTRENIPFSVAIDQGFDEIYLLLNYPLDVAEHFDVNFEVKGLKNIAIRSLELMMVENYLQDITLLLDRNQSEEYKKIKLHVIAPEKKILDTMDFDPLKIAVGINAGREAAKKVLGEIK